MKLRYKDKDGKELIGLMHWDIGGYKPYDIEVVAAFDVDKRKVGKDVAEAIFAPPNCTTIFCKDIPNTGVDVKMGKILDGIAEHMSNYDDKYTFIPSNEKEATRDDVINTLKLSSGRV